MICLLYFFNIEILLIWTSSKKRRPHMPSILFVDVTSQDLFAWFPLLRSMLKAVASEVGTQTFLVITILHPEQPKLTLLHPEQPKLTPLHPAQPKLTLLHPEQPKHPIAPRTAKTHPIAPRTAKTHLIATRTAKTHPIAPRTAKTP